jgi:predicted Zn-dependent protease
MEGTMGDEEHDKSIIEKTIETVKDIATKASDAAKKALEPEPPKSGEEVVFLPAAGGEAAARRGR